jgi:hypothetical protein
MREEDSSIREELERCYLRTSEAARRSEPHRIIHLHPRGALLDPGEVAEDICNCDSHSVPSDIFAILPDSSKWKALVLQHFASVWLDESIAIIRNHCVDPRSFNNVLRVVREFFGFRRGPTPSRFIEWTHRALRTELESYEQHVTRAVRAGNKASSKLLDEWTAIANGLANSFRHTIEAVLDEIRQKPVDTPASPPKSAKRRKSGRGRRPQAAKKYKSILRRHIRNILTDREDSSDLQVCDAVDDEFIRPNAIPRSWRDTGKRQLREMYQSDEKTRHKIATLISKVRKDMGLKRK